MTLVEIFHHLITDKEHVEHVEDLLDALLTQLHILLLTPKYQTPRWGHH